MTGGLTILWFRRDLRLSDLPMLDAARSGPVLPVFVLDPETEALGAAAKWRLAEAISAFASRLETLGSRLILRRGPAPAVLQRLATETDACAVHWTRLYDPASQARDRTVKTRLRASGTAAVSHPGHLLAEPWEIATEDGHGFRVFAPFWRRLAASEPPPPYPAVHSLTGPAQWPASDRLEDWRLGSGLQRGAAVLAAHLGVGETAAHARLQRFLDGPIAGYRDGRDRLDLPGTSQLSENLTYGEIGPRSLWHAAIASAPAAASGADAFRRQLAWRDFAWHLLYHAPHLADRNWREGWDAFPWRGDNPDAEAWRRGMTGEALVDAGLREMYVSGRMHNRARMVVASYLTKHLLTDWRVGLAWFADCLTDWDPAANALGWQWVAGSGPDAAPFFRIFNPASQAATHDPSAAYRHRFLAELAPNPGREALSYFEAVPRSWGLDPARPYPAPRIGLAEGRARALRAFSGLRG